MLKATKIDANRVDIDLSGQIDAKAMEAGLDELIALSEDVRHGKSLYTISDFRMPTMGAIAVEFGRLPKLFGLIGKFDRCAVVTDIAWLRTAAEVEGALIPGLEIKSFEMHEREAAETWLTGG